jgi:uncharacterized protein DUF1376
VASGQDEPQAPAWYRWHWEAFIKATRGWNFIQRAIYRELLDVQWQEGAVPIEPERCRRMIGCDRQQWEEAWPAIEEKFPIGRGRSKARRNPKMAAERERSIAAIRKMIAAGKMGGQRSGVQRRRTPIVGKTAVFDPDTDQSLTKGALEGERSRFRSKRLDSESEAQGSLLAPDLKLAGAAPKKAQPEHAPEFLQFRAIFPKRDGRQRWEDAERFARNLVSRGIYSWQQILDAAQRYADKCQADGIVGMPTVMQAASFLGKEHRENIDLAWRPAPSKADLRNDKNRSAADDWLRQQREKQHA